MAAREALATLEFEYNNEKVIATIPNSLANEIKSLSKSDPGKFGEILRDIYLSQHSEQNNISMIHQNNLSAERGQICEQRNQECPPCNQRDIQSKSSEMENSQSASQEKVHIWTEEQEKLLIEIRFEQEARFQANKSHDTLWNGICSTLNNRGINVMRQQLINKWKNLKKRYKEIVDHNSKTGNNPISWKYYDRFNEFCGNKASTHPKVTIDTGRKESVIKSSGSLSSTESTAAIPSASGSNSTSEGSPSEKSGASAIKRSTGSATKQKRRQRSLDIENNNTDIFATMKMHHKEKMQRMDRLLNVFERIASSGREQSARKGPVENDMDSDSSN